MAATLSLLTYGHQGPGHNTITANSRYLERAVVDTLYANLERLDQRSEIAQADWEAASLKKRFCTHFQTRKAHKELHEDVMDLGGIVRATSKAAQRKRGRGVAGTGIIPEANLHTTHQMEQDISTALPLMLDPTLTHSTGIWTTSPVDIGAQNPFADGVSVQ
ncbi:hypothetical protein C8R43DRAFT_1109087 [Mycena crocata]|nr:hypothetical protein C8R43DRAFT_1109087 [Mycena crocata]